MCRDNGAEGRDIALQEHEIGLALQPSLRDHETNVVSWSAQSENTSHQCSKIQQRPKVARNPAGGRWFVRPRAAAEQE